MKDADTAIGDREPQHPDRDLKLAISKRIELATSGAYLRPPTAPGAEGDPSFGELAIRAAAFQYQRVLPYRRLCEARGIEPENLTPDQWRHLPAVPVEAFKTLALHADEPVEIFRSSGTLGGAARRSVHHHPYPELYRQVIDATFPSACIPQGHDLPRPLLAMVPSRRQATDSSLGFMVDHILSRYGTGSETEGVDSGAVKSRVAFGPNGVDIPEADVFFESVESEGRPATLLATAFALVQWLEGSKRTFRLPPGSTIFETGGFKGKVRELQRSELLARVEERLGVAFTSVVREYGMTELTGHLYTGVLLGGDPDLFVPPPFLKVRLLDPTTFEDVAEGETGLVAFFDLANLGSAVHVVSQDLGRWQDGGLRLLGRASGAELRGCSLTVEELASHGPE